MKILTAQQLREADAYTIKTEPIASINLMERASNAFVGWFCKQYDNNRQVVAVCGQGNNGGDGLAIARILSSKGFDVKVLIIAHTDNPSKEFQINLERLGSYSSPNFINNVDELPPISPEIIYIDAMLGAGLSRPTSGIIKAVIQEINLAQAEIIAVDIASGLYMDQINKSDEIIIKPKFTVSFQLPKLAFFFPQNAIFVGEWLCVDIGLDTSFISQCTSSYFYTEPLLTGGDLTKREKFTHKGTYGHALIIAGSYGKMGAAILAGKSCLRSGVGLLTVHIPNCGYEIMQISIPEAMVSVDDKEFFVSTFPNHELFTTIGIGPGLDKDEATEEMLFRLLFAFKNPMVIDADALNILAKNQDWIPMVPKNSILTPHPKEFERLVGISENEFVRLEKAKAFAKKFNLIICLKGANTAVILTDGQVYFNSTGNPGMATGGTGDALTGIITGLLAQGLSPQDAAILGVYEHGKAGDVAAKIKGERAMLASDLIDCIRI